ncbi:E2F/DP family winged-helix DNA-binding domain-containing protein [Glomus cerebriforme]|uniref:E2F/DP family winged-helix DNA-binding domain-containing protein n=1 Tax=Glomus cerebriforme TaxID=658196 RepID=A0A397SJ94_9GLOM|nr:E2F/DP family winged-helix DNA-binding domain-containing protein [Glomus cerebriforme]RIA90334.1 E2F/DP family winged-helix DNA-binding domain-containing protein [Glomus cerebriforme]
MATPPFTLLPPNLSAPVHTAPPRHCVYSSDPSAHVISNNQTKFYFYSTSSPAVTEQRFISKSFENQTTPNNILPPINTSTNIVTGFNTSGNSNLHFSNNVMVSPQLRGRHSPSFARPRLEVRRSSEPNYHIMEYGTSESSPLSAGSFTPPSTLNRFTLQQQDTIQQQFNLQQKLGHMNLSTAPPAKTIMQQMRRRPSTLSQILQSNDDDYRKDRQPIEQINIKRPRFDDRREKGDRDSEDGDSNGSCNNICQESSGITPCLSSLHIVPTTNAMSSSKSSPVTTNDSSDTGSMLGEQVPQQQILRQNKGLRHFSKQVCDKVELKGVTTYNEVADELAEDFAAQMSEHGSGQKVDQKNIRRRVYDALNVLMAMDIIAKDKKEIRWLGLPGQKNGANSAKSSVTTDAEIERQKSELRELERLNRRLCKQVDEAKVVFQDKLARHLHIRNLVKRNKRHNPYRVSNNKLKSEKELHLPFKLLHCPRGTTIECQNGQDGFSQILSFHPHQPTILEDAHILQHIGMDKISPEDMQQWVNPEHLKWIVTKQGDDGDYRISCAQ